MDMKLNGQLVRQLRLERSWSQEQLAEKALLNPRTIVRVENEGSGSLRTRHALAKALGVKPVTLDVNAEAEHDSLSVAAGKHPILEKISIYLESRNSYQFILMLLLVLFYLASRPFFFSYSRFNFSWLNFSLLKPMIAVPEWWFFTLAFWLMFALPWLFVVAKKYPRLLGLHSAAMGFVLLLSFVRLWQPELVMGAVSFCLYYSALALLALQFMDNRDDTYVRQAVIVLLACYIFLWYFQSVSFFFLTSFYAASHIAVELPPVKLYGKLFFLELEKLTQLIPVAVALLVSLHKHVEGNGRHSPTLVNRETGSVQEEDQENTISSSSMSTLMASPGA